LKDMGLAVVRLHVLQREQRAHSAITENQRPAPR
jgi:hypothetical protein